MPQTQSRHWCFTLNNPLEPYILPSWSGIVYRIYQLEKGASGTIHLQGFVSFVKRHTFGPVKRLLPTAHWEIAKGNPAQNKAYCSKEETRLAGPWEEGELPGGQGARNDLETAAKLAKQNKWNDIDPSVYVKFHRGLHAYALLNLPQRSEKPTVIWLYGGTGTGKSKTARDIGGDDQYWKPHGKWWCGYHQQPTVVIDELRPEEISFYHLLRVLDRYPLSVEPKGGNVQLNSPLIIITAPYEPRRLYYEVNSEDILQLERRITLCLELK